MTRPLHILNVANKRLPDHDYRIQYRERSSMARVTFGLPGKPDSLRPEEFVEMGFSEGISLSDLAHFFALGNHLFKRRGEYDLVHFFSTKLQLLGPIIAASLGVPSVSTITGFGRTYNRTELRYRLLRPIYLWLLRRSVARSKAIFFQNHGDKQWLQEKFPDQAHKMHWIGSGVEAAPIRQKDFERQPLVVLMVARLMPDKGVSDYLEAARQLHGKQMRFLLVGPPSVGQEALYRQVELANEQGIIEYLGELDQQELRERYEQSHIFAFPSHGEGMPRVMLEAGHALLCPIASDIPAHRDLVERGGGLLIAKEKKVESLVAHLQAVQADRALLEGNAIAFQRHIVSQYTVEAYANRMDKFLQGLFPVVQLNDKRSSSVAA